MVGIKIVSNINCYPMQNYTNFLIYALQLYLNFVKSQLHLIIYKNNLTYACYNKRPVKLALRDVCMFGLTPNGEAVDHSSCFAKPKWLLCLQINNINKRKSCSP